jgi:hypothetical protein
MIRYLTIALAGILLLGATAEIQSQTYARKPFLQMGTPTSASVCWRLSTATALTVRFGTDSTNLSRQSAPSAASANACVSLDTLLPSTKYHYKLYAGATEIPGSTQQYVVTHPPANSRAKHSFWVIGDFGIGPNHSTYGNAQLHVRDAYVNVNGGNHTDGVLMLGDVAYESGTDNELTNGVFNIYPDIMANSFAWPVIGNHEAPNITSGYLAGFTLPTAGQSGGVASGTEYYYSFDYGNIHFINLDSEISNRTTTGPMYQWLQQDLQATQKDWIVVTFHHPPYTRGSHNSETEAKHVNMRYTFLPLLEQYGVDLVLGGHSHNYERSYLLDSAYSSSSTSTTQSTHTTWYTTYRSRIILDSSSGNHATTGPYRKVKGGNKGAVYAVVGSSGKVATSNRHPLMFVNYGILGSMILDIEDSVLTGRFIDTTRTIRDQFRIEKTLPSVSIGDAPEARALKSGSASFDRAGRVFHFAGDNTSALRVFTLDGRLLFEGIPKGRWEASRKDFPPGEYYFRHAGALGKISLQ